MPPPAAKHQTSRRQLHAAVTHLAQHVAILELAIGLVENAGVADRSDRQMTEIGAA